MADFVQTMKDWRRMCQAYKNHCDLCPLASYECGAVPRNMKYFTDKQVEGIIMSWAEEHPEPVYPLWGEWLISIGAARREPNGIPFQLANGDIIDPPFEIAVNLYDPIPADIAQKLGIEPKEDV